jgi:hypothetical protein
MTNDLLDSVALATGSVHQALRSGTTGIAAPGVRFCSVRLPCGFVFYVGLIWEFSLYE